MWKHAHLWMIMDVVPIKNGDVPTSMLVFLRVNDYNMRQVFPDSRLPGKKDHQLWWTMELRDCLGAGV